MTSETRQIRLVSATMLVAGNMIGAGIFMMPTVMASIGAVSTLGWLVTAPGAFMIGYVFARLGQVRPKAGGPYAYAPEALGDFAGFQCNLLYWFSNVIANIAIDHRLSVRVHAATQVSASGCLEHRYRHLAFSPDEHSGAAAGYAI